MLRRIFRTLLDGTPRVLQSPEPASNTGPQIQPPAKGIFERATGVAGHYGSLLSYNDRPRALARAWGLRTLKRTPPKALVEVTYRSAEIPFDAGIVSQQLERRAFLDRQGLEQELLAIKPGSRAHHFAQQALRELERIEAQHPPARPNEPGHNAS